MALLEKYTSTLGRLNATHLLRRSTFKFDKARIDFFASLTAEEAVSELFKINAVTVPEPVDDKTLQPYINSGVNPSTNNSTLNKNIVAWWIEEALRDTSIGHKLELFLHSTLAINFELATPRQNFDYLALFRLAATEYDQGGLDMGSYKNLALKLITDNAMLIYLDGKLNVKANPNENFAREFFEIYTIGKGQQVAPGNYTTYMESDIVEAAKLLTGWTKEDRPIGQGGDPNYTDPQTGIQRGKPHYNVHNTDLKLFSSAFDSRIITPALDEEDMWRELSDFVEMVFDKQETARNICRKIYRFFVNPLITQEIEVDIIEPLSLTLYNSNYRLKETIQELLQSKHFYDLDDGNQGDENFGSLIKSPLELLLQTMSFFHISTPHYLDDSTNHYRLWYHFTVLGFLMDQGGFPLFFPSSVSGYSGYFQAPGYSRNWFSASTMIARYRIPEVLLTGKRSINGGSTGGVVLNLVEYVKSSSTFSDPSNAILMVKEWTDLLLVKPPLPDRLKYFEDLLLDNLSPQNWQFEWENFINTGDDSKVKIPLETLFIAFISSQEYGIM